MTFVTIDKGVLERELEIGLSTVTLVSGQHQLARFEGRLLETVRPTPQRMNAPLFADGHLRSVYK